MGKVDFLKLPGDSTARLTVQSDAHHGAVVQIQSKANALRRLVERRDIAPRRRPVDRWQPRLHLSPHPLARHRRGAFGFDQVQRVNDVLQRLDGRRTAAIADAVDLLGTDAGLRRHPGR